MPLIETTGAASSKGFGEFAQTGVIKYIENFFSTWLRTGTGSSATITTGLDASVNKALVWTKSRAAATGHKLTDTVRGATKALISNTTGAQTTDANGLTAFSSTGYTIGSDTNYNNSGATYVDWEFVATPKFFDIVTYTGDGVAGRQISHSLGSAPGCVIIKGTSSTSDWGIWHRGNGGSTDITGLTLNATNAAAYPNAGYSSSFTSTTFKPTDVYTAGGANYFNISGDTYVAYLFAHNAGGFGLTGSDNVISCGSYVGASSIDASVTLGWEPQWVLVKKTNASGTNWVVADNMRGMPVSNSTNVLYPNTSGAEYTPDLFIKPTATGFLAQQGNSAVNGAGTDSFIYIAIRRGPMKVPTSGTSVYQPLTGQPNGSGLFAHNILTDFSFYHYAGGTQNWGVQDRLRGAPDLSFNSTAAENGLVGGNVWSVMTGYINPNPAAGNYDSWAFRRAPGFFDEVCYTGNGSTQNQSHNLAVVPELMIVKARDLGSRSWAVYFGDNGKAMSLDNTTASRSFAGWNYTTPTTSVFSLGADSDVNSSGYTYVAYLFASCPGVSKVGSYTGTGALQTVNCGFTGGARFVLIKRTDSTGDWYVYDSARGISSGNDPYILLNSSAGGVTGTNYVDTDSTGFKVTAAAPAGLNANGGSFVFLAIA